MKPSDALQKGSSYHKKPAKSVVALSQVYNLRATHSSVPNTDSAVLNSRILVYLSGIISDGVSPFKITSKVARFTMQSNRTNPQLPTYSS